jgi:hypothetical protein
MAPAARLKRQRGQHRRDCHQVESLKIIGILLWLKVHSAALDRLVNWLHFSLEVKNERLQARPNLVV